ncbi:hypothetical protein J6590_031161 [Homalodisca vitripennis]|nr:hypothetical protein J6590_031161 [Homalodisca vitripennis]
MPRGLRGKSSHGLGATRCQGVVEAGSCQRTGIFYFGKGSIQRSRQFCKSVLLHDWRPSIPRCAAKEG